MLLVFKWGLKWEQGRYFREQPGPEGRSSRSPRCTITVRLDEDGDMENMIVCVSWWGRCKENAAQMIYAREPVRVGSELGCVCVCCEISSCSRRSPFFFPSCLHKRKGSTHCVCDIREQERLSDHVPHNVFLLNERLPWSHCFSTGIQLTTIIQSWALFKLSSRFSFWACVHF